MRLHNLDISVGKIITAFVKNGLEVSQAVTSEESLEDYFKRVTGGEGIVIHSKTCIGKYLSCYGKLRLDQLPKL